MGLCFGKHIELVLPALGIVFSGVRIFTTKDLIDAFQATAVKRQCYGNTQKLVGIRLKKMIER